MPRFLVDQKVKLSIVCRCVYEVIFCRSGKLLSFPDCVVTSRFSSIVSSGQCQELALFQFYLKTEK